MKPYQGQRQSGRKPRNWEILREYMEQYEGDQFQIKEWTTREADDGMAYVAAVAAGAGKLAGIATADKDMRMLPGRHVIWKTWQIHDVPLGTFESVGPDGKLYGHKWFWQQMLQGDTADNIPGLERYITPSGKPAQVGEVTAVKLLGGIHNNLDACSIVGGLYLGYYGEETWADRFAEQASLLWLRTDRHAAFDDFLAVIPSWSMNIRKAAERLNARILEARRKLTEGEE